MELYEDVPNQRKPWTLQLQTQLEKLCEDKPQDSLVLATRNFFSNGIIAGDRRCESGQPGFNRDPETPQLNNRGDPYAFMKGDIIFFAANWRQVIPQARAIKHPKSDFFVKKRYRVQKNGDNGAKKLHARNRAHPHLCNVKHWLAIIDRFCRLVGKSVTNRPLAVYRDERTSKVLHICSNDLLKTMQMVVKLEYV